jgi:hypothetical protein
MRLVIDGPINVVVSRLMGVDLPFVVALARMNSLIFSVLGIRDVVGQGYTEPNAIADFVDQVNRKFPSWNLSVSQVRIADRVIVGLKGIDHARIE